MQEEILDSKPHDINERVCALVIANPIAGSYEREKPKIEETVTYLRQQGWDAELRLTEGQGDGRKLAREAVERNLDVVVAVGGDGTINEVIQELAGSNTALGVLPGGTVNVWARETGIPFEFDGAREVLVKGQTRCIDLGKVHDRYFLLMSTLGFDAEVTHIVEKKPVKKLGVFGYLVLGTWLGIGYPNFYAVLEMGGKVRRMRALQIVIGNTQLYAGAIKFTWQARIDDGALDVCIVRSASPWERLGVMVDFLLRRKRRERWVRYETADVVKIHTSKPVAIQVDGDPSGYTGDEGKPTIFSIEKRALKVIVPRELPEELFS